jgi:hypothetical protein
MLGNFRTGNRVFRLVFDPVAQSQPKRDWVAQSKTSK